MLNKLSIIILLSLFLNQCTTYTVKKDMSQKGELTKTPKWYIKFDREDKTWMYETASSVSPDLELAIKKSTLLAKAKLADRINGKMNSKSLIIKDEEGLNENLSIDANAKDEINNIIKDTLVRYYIVDKVDVFFTHYKSYRAYVRLKVSKDHVDAVLQEIKADKKLVQKIEPNKIKKKINEVLNND